MNGLCQPAPCGINDMRGSASIMQVDNGFVVSVNYSDECGRYKAEQLIAKTFQEACKLTQKAFK